MVAGCQRNENVIYIPYVARGYHVNSCTRSADLYAYVINFAYAKCTYIYMGKAELRGCKAKQEVSVNPCLLSSNKSS